MPLATNPRLVVRPVSAGDAILLERLGPQARSLRFDGRVTLAAVDPRDGSIAGVAQYAPGGDGSSDVTFAVADEWQRRGVGAMLALALLRRASADRRRRIAAVLWPRSRRPALAGWPAWMRACSFRAVRVLSAAVPLPAIRADSFTICVNESARSGA